MSNEKNSNKTADVLLKMSALGLSKEEIARVLSISVKSLNEIINSNSLLKEAFEINLVLADIKVMRSLFKRATGTKKKKTVKRIEDSINPKDGQIEALTKTEEITEEVLGDVSAQKFWLSNRRPELFTDVNIDKIKSILDN